MKKLDFNLKKETIEALSSQEMGQIAGGEAMFNTRLWCKPAQDEPSETAPATSKQPDNSDMPNCPDCAITTPNPNGPVLGVDAGGGATVGIVNVATYPNVNLGM